MLIRPLFMLLFVVSLRVAAQPLSLETALGEPILPANQPLAEVQVYCFPREIHVISRAAFNSGRRRAELLRQRVLNEVVLRGEARQWAEAKTRVEWLEMLSGNGYRNVSATR